MNPKIYAGTYPIIWDDAWHHIVVNEHILHLSPTQYRVCRGFLSKSKPRNDLLTSELIILSYCSYDELQEEADLSRSVLIKHVSNLNTRLTTSGLQLRYFQFGYILTFSSNPIRNVQYYKESRTTD